MIEKFDLQTRIRSDFSRRLIHILKKNGYTSTRAHNGVSAQAIANAIGCSFTIAKKYISGKALPENKTMEKLARWLQVDIWWLLYGNKDQTTALDFDKSLLQDILTEAKDLLVEHQGHWEYIIKHLFNIYDNISCLDGTSENKKNSIRLMIDFLSKTLDAK